MDLKRNRPMPPDYNITSNGTCLGPAEETAIRDAIIPEGVTCIGKDALRTASAWPPSRFPTA